LGNDMTAPDKKPQRAADWVAVRRAYEAGIDPLPAIAFQHGVNERTIQRRRLKEGWFTRRDRARAARAPGACPQEGSVDWLDVRREYESGEHSIWEICKHHGCGRTSLHQRRQEENWEQRRPAFPKAFGAGGKVNAAVRLKALLVKKLEALEQHLQLDEKIDPADPLKGMLTLAGALQKILDIEAKEKRRDDGDSAGRLIINDASREALARRIEALAASWEAAGDSGGT
jgi:transposase-like protein